MNLKLPGLHGLPFALLITHSIESASEIQAISY
jgi:hypothetical protein